MVTKEIAVLAGATWGGVEFHRGRCVLSVDSLGNRKLKSERWKSNGKCKLWRKQRERFYLPVKSGFRHYSAITETNAGEWHLAEACAPEVPFIP